MRYLSIRREIEGSLPTVAVLQEFYPDVPVEKAWLGQAITEFDRPRSKLVGEIKALFRECAEQAVRTLHIINLIFTRKFVY